MTTNGPDGWQADQIHQALQRLIKSDPYLAPYHDIIYRRLKKIAQTRQQLTGGRASLADFASGHEYFGLHFKDKQWVFREWAPNATAVFLIGEMSGWQERKEFALNPCPDGIWEIHRGFGRVPADDLGNGDEVAQMFVDVRPAQRCSQEDPGLALARVEFRRNEDEQGIRESADKIRALIDREKERGVPSERIVLAGFSQGGAVALHTGLRYPEKLAGLIGLSTFLPLAWTIDGLPSSSRINLASCSIDTFLSLTSTPRCV